MAKRSGQPHIPFWGRFTTSADLPNVALAAKQTPQLETGDTAFTTSDSTFWVCMDATVGAAVWTPLAGGSSVIVFQPGGTAIAGRVVTTYPALKAAVAAFPGPATVIFDDTFSTPIVLPADTWTVTYQMNWRGLGNFVTPVQLQLSDNFICQTTSGVCALGEYHGDVALTADATTVAPFPITAPAGSTTQCYGTPAPVPPPISGGANGVFEATGAGNAAFDFFGLGLGANVINANGSTVFVGAFDGANLTTQWAIGAGAVVVVATDGSALFEQNQTGLASGTYASMSNQYLGGRLESRADIVTAGGTVGIQGSDRYIAMKTAGGAMPPLLLNTGTPGTNLARVVWIEDVDGSAVTNPITLRCQGGQTLNGSSADFVVAVPYAMIRLTTSDGTAYQAQVISNGAVIPNPPAASTGNVTIDTSNSPRTDYYMGPTANRTFDPTAATVSQRITITKTTNSTNKITLPATVGWTYFPTGAANTAFDLPGSATNSATATHQWTLTIDVPNKIVYVSPPA